MMSGPYAVAEQALIIANFAYDGVTVDRQVRERAVDVSETLFGLGYTVNRLENPSVGRVTEALTSIASSEGPVVIYYAGRTSVEGDGTRLLATDGTSALVLGDVLDRAAVGDRDATLVFLDVCLEDIPAAPAVDETQETTADDEQIVEVDAAIAPFPQRDRLFIASAAGPGQPCADDDATLTEVILDRLLVPGLGTDTMFDDTTVSVSSTLQAPFVFRRTDSGMRLTAEDYQMLDNLSPEAQAEMLALWEENGIAVDRTDIASASPGTQMVSNETVTLTSPIQPVSSGVTLVPVTPSATRVQGGVSLAPQSPATLTQASVTRPVPGAGGLPEPSIIVGRIAPTEASFSTATEPSGPVSGTTFAYDDIEGRRTLRDSDPEFFATLVDAGAFDPPPEEIVVALQTELQNMNCYTSRIDGDWGPGSRRAVARYYEELGTSAPSQDADVSIFRQIALRDDVTCPAVQVASPPRQTQTTQPRTNTQPRQQTQTAPQTQTQTAQPPRVINQTGGTGFFR